MPLDLIADCEPQYKWNKTVYLSPNAVLLVLDLLSKYDPEPWEVELVKETAHRLRIAQ